jgi:hypothetical protein
VRATHVVSAVMADERELRAISDKMLSMLERLGELEQTKRNLTLGTDEFVGSANEVERLAQLVFRWAQMQLLLARQSQHDGLPSLPLTAVTPRPLDRILAEWRAAQLRLDAALPGSPESEAAASDVERLREEYRRGQDARR